jgi:hypothetical protein
VVIFRGAFSITGYFNGYTGGVAIDIAVGKTHLSKTPAFDKTGKG